MSLTISEILSQLSKDDERLLISLPYRAGLYVSFADTTGGWQAQDREIQSLTAILQEFSQDYFKTEFTRLILMETLAARIDWLAWSRDIQKVPEQAKHVSKTLASFMEAGELEPFYDVMLDIAVTVAMAFQEHHEVEPAPTEEGSASVIKSLITRLMGNKKQGHPLSHTNISEQEKTALYTLSESLGYTGFLA